MINLMREGMPKTELSWKLGILYQIISQILNTNKEFLKETLY